MTITYLEAYQNPSRRQEYVAHLVQTSGKKFPFVRAFRYVPFTEMHAAPDKFSCISDVLIQKATGDARIALEQLREKEFQECTGTCKPEGELGSTLSNIYFTEANFSNNFHTLYTKGITSREIEALQGIELTVHEPAHAEHFGKGIEGFGLDEFSLDTIPGRVLFLTASEIEAHEKHIQALGTAGIKTDFLRIAQEFFIKMRTDCLKSLPSFAQQNPSFAPLARRIFDKNRELHYTKIQPLLTNQYIFVLPLSTN